MLGCFSPDEKKGLQGEQREVKLVNPVMVTKDEMG